MQKMPVTYHHKRQLIINELQICLYQVSRLRVLQKHIILLFFFFSLISCSENKITSKLQTAEDLLWSRPDSCILFLKNLDFSTMSTKDIYVCALYNEHAMLKVNQGIEDNSKLLGLKDYFEKTNNHRYAGEACYIIGRNLELEQNLPMATFYQKEAETHLLQADNVPAQLLGMVYYCLGGCSEYERLFDVANEYYQEALSYFMMSGDSLYISSAYRDVAKTLPGEYDKALILLDSAYLYLPSTAWKGYKLELDMNRRHHVLHEEPDQYIGIYHTLCDSLQIIRYAAVLCDYYLNKGQLDSALFYLTASVLDTANSTWSKENYLSNKASYYYGTGMKDSAFFVLRDLHLWQTEEIETSAHTRSYMVEQRYDAERERADRIKAEADKHKAHLIIIIVCISAMLLMGILLLLLKQERMKKRQKEEHNRMLMEQLRLKQGHLQKQLKMRLNLSSELKMQKSQGRKFSIETYQHLMSNIVFISPEQWKTLQKEFDIAYAGLLTNLSAKYSQLTDTDRLYIALIVLGCGNEEISELVNVSAQSVRNRKMLLKQHVNANCNIEIWLKTEVEATLSAFTNL